MVNLMAWTQLPSGRLNGTTDKGVAVLTGQIAQVICTTSLGELIVETKLFAQFKLSKKAGPMKVRTLN